MVPSPVEKRALLRSLAFVYYFCTDPLLKGNGTKVLGTNEKVVEYSYTRTVHSMTISPQSNSRPLLLLLIPHLGGGGAEQVTAMLSRGLDPRKYELHLALITQSPDDPEFASAELPRWVNIHPLGARRVRSSALPLLHLLSKLRPQIILSGMYHLNFLVLLLRPFLGFPVRILIRQNSTASSAVLGIPRYNRLLYRMLYPRADCVICQTAAMARDLRDSFSVPERRLRTLPNPINFAGLCSATPAPPEAWPGIGPHLLAVGRLSPEKGFDLLLYSMAIVRRQFPSADLLIAGTGPEESNLKALSHSLSLESAVRFVGHVANPATYFSAASLFVLSSRHEGLPNALLEAAAAGLPIVSTAASEGLVELIRHQPGVWLAPTPTSEGLAEALVEALTTLEPGKRFQHTFMTPFSLSSALPAWEELIDRFLPDARGTQVLAERDAARAV
jgi:glycosyltransferase involved in cell wall biosynthesis